MATQQELEALAAMGPRARAALPPLEEVVNREPYDMDEHGLRRAARQAIRSISNPAAEP